MVFMQATKLDNKFNKLCYKEELHIDKFAIGL